MSDETQSADIDFNGPFTIDEIIEIEQLAGKPITDLLEGNRGHSLRVVAWVIARRENPAATLADVGQLWVKLDG